MTWAGGTLTLGLVCPCYKRKRHGSRNIIFPDIKTTWTKRLFKRQLEVSRFLHREVVADDKFLFKFLNLLSVILIIQRKYSDYGSSFQYSVSTHKNTKS